MKTDRGYIGSRDDLREGETLFYQHRLEGAIDLLKEGDRLRIVKSSNQKCPEGKVLTVTDTNYGEPVVANPFEGSYKMIPFDYGGPKADRSAWLRTKEGDSRGEILQFEIVHLEGGDEE